MDYRRALLPAVAFVWAMIGWLRAVMAFDELGRRVHAEAAIGTLGVVVLASVTYGFLQSFVGLPLLSGFAVMVAVAVIYLASVTFAQRRYA